jgi:GT2 family glycosyltransferase
MKKVFVVIPNWNGADLIAEALQSLQAQTYPAQIIVVDNGSVDNSVEIIGKRFPEVQLIKLSENTGFAGGVNQGIKYALEHDAEAIALFNNDAVAASDWLEQLVKTMEATPGAGIVTGKLVRNNKIHLDSTGDYYSVWGMPFPRGRNQKDEGQYNQTEEVFGASGGASLYRAELFEQIGTFDERFFAYYEDVDISFRAQLAGWRVLYQPKAVAYHHVSATSSKLGSFTRYHATKNFYLLYTKNMPGRLFWKYLPKFLVQSIRLGASSLLKGGIIPYLRGFVRSVLYLPSTLGKRQRIQSQRKVTSDYIDGLLYKHRPPRIPTIS